MVSRDSEVPTTAHGEFVCGSKGGFGSALLSSDLDSRKSAMLLSRNLLHFEGQGGHESTSICASTIVNFRPQNLSTSAPNPPVYFEHLRHPQSLVLALIDIFDSISCVDHFH